MSDPEFHESKYREPGVVDFLTLFAVPAIVFIGLCYRAFLRIREVTAA